MLHWTLRDWRVQLLIVLLWDGVCAPKVKPTPWPLYSKKPLLLAWNVPTQDCGSRHGVSLQLDQFQIVASSSQTLVRQNLTFFYPDRLGLYPYFKTDATPVRGGLPQAASLSQHLREMQKNVDKYIPNRGAVGLAVIDWEEWRPLWVRNYGRRHMYREQSFELARQKNPTWSDDQARRAAQLEFEEAAKKFMLETLRRGNRLRPNTLWGFYLYPDCHNHNYMASLWGYKGECPSMDMVRNERLRWLWSESTALFPSIYMGKALRSSSPGRQFVRHRVREGIRLSSFGEEFSRPVFVYTRPIYDDSLEHLTEFDLVSTIGESVALGAAGIIMWGDVTHAKNKTTCSDLNAYLQGTLSQYLLNVSTAAELCSQTLCGSHGRCLRKRWDKDVYLHLNRLTHRIERRKGKLTVIGKLGDSDKVLLDKDFQCQWYKCFKEGGCSYTQPQKEPPKKGAATRTRTSVLQSIIFLMTVVLLC
uniref:Hyaluronidase n=2 Tax=Xiphophorus maculatus TaxID=8083 RepID=A0A3B5R8G8_XIPMA